MQDFSQKSWFYGPFSFPPGAPPTGPLQGPPYGAPWGLAAQGSGGRGALWQLGWAVGLWLSAGFWLASKLSAWIFLIPGWILISI